MCHLHRCSTMHSSSLSASCSFTSNKVKHRLGPRMMPAHVPLMWHCSAMSTGDPSHSLNIIRWTHILPNSDVVVLCKIKIHTYWLVVIIGLNWLLVCLAFWSMFVFVSTIRKWQEMSWLHIQTSLNLRLKELVVETLGSSLLFVCHFGK